MLRSKVFSFCFICFDLLALPVLAARAVCVCVCVCVCVVCTRYVHLEEVEVYLYSFLPSALGGRERLTSRPDRGEHLDTH